MILASSRSLERSVQILCQVNIFILKIHYKFLFHKEIAYDLKMCNDFVLRSFCLVLDHWKKKCTIRVRFKYFLWIDIISYYFIKRLLMTDSVSRYWFKVICGNANNRRGGGYNFILLIILSMTRIFKIIVEWKIHMQTGQPKFVYKRVAHVYLWNGILCFMKNIILNSAQNWSWPFLWLKLVQRSFI